MIKYKIDTIMFHKLFQPIKFVETVIISLKEVSTFELDTLHGYE